MPKISMQELREMGVSQEDINLARTTQAAQRRTGSPVQSVAVLVGAVQPRRRTGAGKGRADGSADFTSRALRRRGVYDQAALLLDQQALSERSPERAVRAREAAGIAKDLSAATQLEFDFFGGGNVSISFQYQDAIAERLAARAVSPAKRDRALSILWAICRHMSWGNHTCDKTASQLCDITGHNKTDMAQSLQLLEDVGAIRRIKRGRVKVITVTPEGAYRGNINEHGKAVERYKLEVIDGGLVNG